ncbi:MAG: cysteine--tRNA ligase, partial [Candidatus Omnitrophica bacterium]|nr:cysteine--tRNA ligase [Candidatus Omnitrophota bacterium]
MASENGREEGPRRRVMSLVITNTLTGRKEPFEPVHPPQARMYVCGPTVYDNPHIGHIRGAFVFDVIRKYLQYRGHSVKFIRNITDVDDKIIEKACENEVTSHKSQVTSERPEDLKRACEEIALKYTNAYHQALEDLGIDPPDEEPRATQQIPKMIQMIGELIRKGIAYAAEGSVYFSVNDFKKYGKLSHQSPEQLLKSHRVEEGHGKRDALDFALWKSAKPEEPSWPSPWGPGRPGWHIECSVMSQSQFGETLDIHGGGMDLVFPHHENEIAQSEACWEKPFANYWLHNGLLTVEGQKMSKSVGNVVGTEDVLAQGYEPDDLKLFFLQSHYRSPIDFGKEKMKIAKNNRLTFETFFMKCETERRDNKRTARITSEIQEKRIQFEEAMDDDFNTPVALATLFELLKLGNISLAKANAEEAIGVEQEIKKLGKIFGLFQGELKEPSANITTLIKSREEFR